MKKEGGGRKCPFLKAQKGTHSVAVIAHGREKVLEGRKGEKGERGLERKGLLDILYEGKRA